MTAYSRVRKKFTRPWGQGIPMTKKSSKGRIPNVG